MLTFCPCTVFELLAHRKGTSQINICASSSNLFQNSWTGSICCIAQMSLSITVRFFELRKTLLFLVCVRPPKYLLGWRVSQFRASHLYTTTVSEY